MLRAIVHSKDKGIKIPIDKENEEEYYNVNFRYLYPQIEDFFTASIFSRLCYLDGESLSSIFGKCIEKDLCFGELESKEFWPRWKDVTGRQSQVEPDVFMRFEKCDVIIEAKRYDDGGQYKNQLEREIKAYFEAYKDSGKPVFLFAVGGFWSGLLRDIANLNKDLRGKAKIIAIKWQSLFEKIKESNINEHIKEDLLLAFELHGFREMLFLKDLSNANNLFPKNYQNAIAILSLGIIHKPDWDGFRDILNFIRIKNYNRTMEVLKWK